jgi:hypothetical protein
VYTYRETCACTNIRVRSTNTDAHKHTATHTYMHTCMHAYIHAYIHTQMVAESISMSVQYGFKQHLCTALSHHRAGSDSEPFLQDRLRLLRALANVTIHLWGDNFTSSCVFESECLRGDHVPAHVYVWHRHRCSEIAWFPIADPADVRHCSDLHTTCMCGCVCVCMCMCVRACVRECVCVCVCVRVCIIYIYSIDIDILKSCSFRLLMLHM